MKAVWDWIVQAAKDVYSTVWSLLSVFRDKTGKYSFKRVSGAVAFVYGLDLILRGGRIEGGILLLYAIVVAIIAALTGT